tara:strand:- start:3118 stop:4014 length:897 start_codon:yes stop_codon:yes gene_type:complete
MPIGIDVTKPQEGNPTTASVRENFVKANDGINDYRRTSKDFATSSGTETAYVVSFSPAATKTAGERATVLFHVGNGTSGSTININSTGISPITVFGNVALTQGMIKAGAYHELMWNAVNSSWELLNPYPVQAGYFSSNKIINIAGAITGSASTSFFGSTTINTVAAAVSGLAAYPVGSLYLTTTTVTPASIFGGTWERYASGKALVGLKTVNDPEYVLGVDSHGSERQTLTADQIPSHTHTTTIEVRENRTSSSGDRPEGSNASVVGSSQFESAPTGGGQSFDNRMPYIAIAIWKRIG